MLFSRGRRFVWAARQVARANVRRLSTPLKLNFALTYWCQYRCKTCNIWKRQPQNELTTDEVLRFVAKNTGVSWLDITGGEVFLRKDIGEVLQAIVVSWRNLALLHFPTNGFLTDQIVSVCERLAARGGPQIIITVSIDGDQRLNDDVRGIQGGYRRQIETFNALRRIPGIRPVFGMTLSKYNLGKFEETFRSCERDCPGLDITDFHLNVAQVSSHYYGNSEMGDVVPDRDGAVRELRLYRAMRSVARTLPDLIETVYLRHLETYLQSGALPMRCHSLRSSCFIDPWGIVFPCITYSRPLGSLRDTDMNLAPLWNAPEITAVQREIWKGDCPQCWTACEAYQSILGNLARPADWRWKSGVTPGIPLHVRHGDPAQSE
jgi:MoaA/NifB/PqqE/SkfB family radical SAM enzyme